MVSVGRDGAPCSNRRGTFRVFARYRLKSKRRAGDSDSFAFRPS